MTNLKASIIYFSLFIFLNSCLSFNDDWIDLGNGYTFHQDGKWKSIYPSNTYYNTQIYSEVINYASDKNYIIATQRPDYEYYKTFVGSNYGTRYAVYTNYLKDSASKIFYKETTPFILQSIKADSSLYKLLKSKSVTDINKIDDQNKIEDVLDSVFHNDPFYIRLFSSKKNYWIIDKKQNINSTT